MKTKIITLLIGLIMFLSVIGSVEAGLGRNFVIETITGNILINTSIINGTNIDCSNVIGEVSGDACNITGGGGSNITNGTGLNLTATVMSIFPSYRLSQTCADGQLVLWNNTAGTWSTCSAPSGGGTVTSVTRGYGFNDTGTSITTTGTLNINDSVLQNRVTGTCGADESIDTIYQNGSVDCETDTDTTNDAVDSSEFDNICGVNDRIPRRSGGTWACFDDSVYYDGNTSWNQSLADTLYADISVTGDNTSWNESLADTKYLQSYTETDPLWSANYSLFNDSWSTTYNATYDSHVQDNTSWNETYADTLYASIGVTGDNTSWNETLADTLYYDIGNSRGFFEDIANFTGTKTDTQICTWDNVGGIINCTYTDLVGGGAGMWVDGGNYIYPNTSFADNVVVFGYVSADNWTNLTNQITQDNTSWNETYADTLYADISVTGDNTSWNESHADTLYADISVTGDNTSWNETYADTLYADISVTGDNTSWNETLADTLYADISVVTDNSSWNETYADTLYYNFSNPASYWNDTSATFNKTYADTLYYDIGNSRSFFEDIVNFTGTLTNTYVCRYDSGNTEIDCDVNPVLSSFPDDVGYYTSDDNITAVAASKVTTGTFGSGNYTFPNDVIIQTNNRYCADPNCDVYMLHNSSHWIVQGNNSQIIVD
jgi:hypothetical protein